MVCAGLCPARGITEEAAFLEIQSHSAVGLVGHKELVRLGEQAETGPLGSPAQQGGCPQTLAALVATC